MLETLLVNKTLAKNLGSLEAAVLLAYIEKKRSDLRDGSLPFILYSINIQEDLLLTKEKRLKLTKILVERGLLKVMRKGMPSKNYYSLDDIKILELGSSENSCSQIFESGEV